jgi:hypothetical protein
MNEKRIKELEAEKEVCLKRASQLQKAFENNRMRVIQIDGILEEFNRDEYKPEIQEDDSSK